MASARFFLLLFLFCGWPPPDPFPRFTVERFSGSLPKNHGEWQRFRSLSLKLAPEVARHSPLPCFRHAEHYRARPSPASAFPQDGPRSTSLNVAQGKELP